MESMAPVFAHSVLAIQILAVQAAIAQLFNDTYTYPAVIIKSSNGACPNEVTERIINNIRRDNEERRRNLTRNNAPCRGSTGWRQVVYLDMSDNSQQCPSGWTEATYDGLRLCGRPANAVYRTCVSATFTVGFQYTSVCGRAVGYQFGDPVAFSLSSGRSIDEYYMDGLTLTYGLSGVRRHIWSFVNGLSEDRRGADACPCAPYASGRSAPSFVGTNYFCESGTVDESNIFSFHNEVLWDGEGCSLSGNTCCSFSSPPYFTTQLQAPTSDNIEGRLCGYQNRNSPGYSGTLIRLLELYVK